jgi:hypothetical protein
MNRDRILALLCATVTCGFILSGCGKEADRPSLSEVKKFTAHPVYYAGSEVAEFPLEEIIGFPLQSGSCCNFIYGDCEPPHTWDGGGCGPPLQIQVWSTCDRWARQFHRRHELYDFRGAKATGGKGGVENGSPIEVFTGRTTVVIGSRDPRVLKTAAQQLREVRATRPQTLPPPAPGSLWGKLSCQRKPGG